MAARLAAAAAPVLRVVEAHARTYRHVWRGHVVTTFAAPLLYLAAMGLGLGTLIDAGASGQPLPGGSYLGFLAPGLLAANAMQTGAMLSTWPVLGGFKWNPTYRSAVATPIRPRELVLGHLVWAVCRLLMAAGAFAAVSALLGAMPPRGALLAVAPGVLVGLAFAAPLTAYTAKVQSEYSLSGVFRFAIVPLFLFSGTFFPISRLPGPLQTVAPLTPLWHGVELVRGAALGTAPAWPPGLHVAFLLAWVLVGAWLAVRLFAGRLVR